MLLGMAAGRFIRQPTQALVNGLKGVAIGMANIVPGVSGGTVAAMTGLYEDLVNALGNFFRGEKGWRGHLKFLAPVIAGALLGNVLGARLIGRWLETAPELVHFGFMGLALGSLPYLARQSGIQRFRPSHGLLFAAGVALVILMGLAPRPAESPVISELTPLTSAWIFGAAFLSGIAMAIPGVSGSFLLLLIGMYRTFQHGFGTLNLPIILLFTVGTLAGAVLFSKLAAALLRTFRSGSYAVLIGLVAGSAAGLFPGFSDGVALHLEWIVLGSGVILGLFLGSGRKARVLQMKKGLR